MRLRLIAISFRPLRYASSRSSVQQPKSSPNFFGSVKAVAMTSATCSGE